MENAAEALKIAFAVMMFVLALTLSISSFSQASLTIDEIIKMSDKVNEYTYVEPADGLYRTVGIDAVVSTMYRALDENIEIYFKKAIYNADGSVNIEDTINSNPISLFYQTRIDVDGYYIMDETKVPRAPKEVYSIDFSVEAPRYEKLYLDVILGGLPAINDALIETFGNEDNKAEIRNDYRQMYEKKLKDPYRQGLYDAFKEEEFIELFGEYYQGEGASEIRKGVITYIIKE